MSPWRKDCAGDAGEPFCPTEGLNTLVEKLIGSQLVRIGLLDKFNVIGIPVGGSAVLLRQTWYARRKRVAAMEPMATDPTLTNELRKEAERIEEDALFSGKSGDTTAAANLLWNPFLAMAAAAIAALSSAVLTTCLEGSQGQI